MPVMTRAFEQYRPFLFAQRLFGIGNPRAGEWAVWVEFEYRDRFVGGQHKSISVRRTFLHCSARPSADPHDAVFGIGVRTIDLGTFERMKQRSGHFAWG